MDRYIKYLPLGVFCLCIGKLLIFSATWESTAVALVTGIVAAAFELKRQDDKVKELEILISNEAKALKEKNEVLTTVLNNHAKAFEEIRTHVSGLNLARTVKPASNTPIQKIF